MPLKTLCKAEKGNIGLYLRIQIRGPANTDPHTLYWFELTMSDGAHNSWANVSQLSPGATLARVQAERWAQDTNDGILAKLNDKIALQSDRASSRDSSGGEASSAVRA